MDKQIEEILYYYNEDGYEGYDLSEVQLLENIDLLRVEKLTALLLHENKYIAYQAMLILVAWNIPVGFNQVYRFFSQNWADTQKFEPHRIHGEDNVFDVIAQALYMSTFNGKTEEELYGYVKMLLSCYETAFFESHLKNLLLKKNFKAILLYIELAMQKSLDSKRYYQASQLFPVIVHYEKGYFNQYINYFKAAIPFDKRVEYNIKEAAEISQFF